MLVVGPNGAGKTNLLESLHVGTQGFSPRTRADAQLVRFGERAGRIGLGGKRGERAVELEVTIELGEGKRAKLNGASLLPATPVARPFGFHLPEAFGTSIAKYRGPGGRPLP